MRIATSGNLVGTLYIYDSNSPFNDVIMNKYMSEGLPITPTSIGLGSDAVRNATVNSLTLDVIMNLTRAPLPSEYKLLDSE